MKTLNEIVAVLSEEQQQVLKDAIKFGAWGDSEYEFINDNGEITTFSMYGYCSNDAKRAGNFQGRKISALFRGIYSRLCPEYNHTIGEVISHCSDWWGDGSGDMFFIRIDFVEMFEEWAGLGRK